MAGLFDFFYEPATPGTDVEVRNMKQVGPGMKEVKGERIPNARIAGPVAEEAAKAGGKGLMGRLGAAAFGPVGTGISLMAPGELGDGERPQAPAPEEISDAQKYAQRVQENAKAAAQPAPQGAGLLMQGQPQQPVPQPQQPPTRANPEVQQKVAERQRQGIQEQVKDQLKTNQLSRNKAAEAVVQADCQRKGIDPAPEVKKQMVAQEVTSMRTMDNDNLSKYLSYALMGLGVVASFADKSGEAANNFADAGINSYYKTKKAQADANQFAAEYKLKAADTERKIKGTESEIKNREQTQVLNKDKFEFDQKYKNTQLDQGDRRLDQGDRGLSQGDRRIGLQAQGLGIQSQGLDLRREQLALQKSRVESQNARDKAAIAKGEKVDVPEMSQKDQTAAVMLELKDRGYKATEGAAGQIAAEKRKLRQQPALKNATEDELSELAMENLKLKPKKPGFFGGLLGSDPELKLGE